jgi:hypothetical protein
MLKNVSTPPNFNIFQNFIKMLRKFVHALAGYILPSVMDNQRPPLPFAFKDCKAAMQLQMDNSCCSKDVP